MKKLANTGRKKLSDLWEKERAKQTLWILLDMTLIGLWAAWVCHEYLNFNPRIVPEGREFGSAIQTNHLWTRFQECGWCAVWNGSVNGGYPAFVDIHGSMLHPFVALSTLLFGVVNGTKVALFLSFWAAGIAQWWIARKLKMSRLAQLWGAGMVIVGGHLAGRMELGAFGVVLSTAMCSLVIGGILTVAQGGGRRAGVLLGVLGAFTILSGQGYMQVGLAGTLVAFPFLILGKDLKLKPIWKNYVLALMIALLISAIFLVPFLHFLPNFVKETDPDFKTAQPLRYLPLNLIIDEWLYYNNEVLGKYPFPHLYTLFIGWVPVILAIIGLAKAKKEDAKWIRFFTGCILIEFLIGSAVILKPLSKIFPKTAGIRHPSQIAGLAIPFIIALSAYGLDRLLKSEWPHTIIRFPSSTSEWNLSLKLLMIIPLFVSLYNGYQSSDIWINTIKWEENIDQLLNGLKTDSLQWVATPFGDHFYVEKAVGMGLKLSPGIRTWKWKDREIPSARLVALREGQPEDARRIDTIDGIPIYLREDEFYAAVHHASAVEACEAHGAGGDIRVSCDNAEPGTLIVKENMWSGWKAWRDGERVTLARENWLEVEAPPGQHEYTFRYLPWDVPLGMALSGLGILVSVLIWRSPSHPSEHVEKRETSS
ncbi:MAG: hypothetical protein R6U57_05420 [Anaerolineales bacterium]